MKFFDAGQRATGVIAIGQEATGIIAFGQMATGIIAVGQLARGVFTVGQLAFGFVGWGQLGLGLMHAIGMVGVGGRRGPGLVIPLVPSIGRTRVPPQTISWQQAQAQPGWIEADLARDQYGIGLFGGGRRLPVKFDRRLQAQSLTLTAQSAQHVWASVTRHGSTLVCDRIVYEPARPYQQKSWFILGALQFVALTVMATVWWVVVGRDLEVFFERLITG